MEYFVVRTRRGAVELTDEREEHIRERHPLISSPAHADQLRLAIESPDDVQDGTWAGSTLLICWAATIRSGRWVAVAVRE